jgi:hypothetical protein
MTEEFNLSKKFSDKLGIRMRSSCEDTHRFYSEEMVKEFIKKLKKRADYLIKSGHDVPRRTDCNTCNVLLELKNNIDELAGDNLK